MTTKKTRIDRPKATLMFLSVALVSFLGCSKNQNDLVHPVEVQFQLLNTAGERTTSFREGDDIVFDYKIVNRGSQDVFWLYHHTNYANLFEVSQVIAGQGIKVIGIPYQNMVMRWLWEKPSHNMKPNDEVIWRMTWMGDWDRSIYLNTVLDGKYDLEGEEALHFNFFEYLHHPPLPKGKYQVTIDQTLEFEGIDDLKVDKVIVFEVF